VRGGYRVGRNKRSALRRMKGKHTAQCPLVIAPYGPINQVADDGEVYMTNETWLMLGILIVGLASLVGFFVTKTKGYGRFAASTLLILIVVIISSLMYSAEKLDSQIMANILFAVIGFAGGLFTGKENSP